MFNLDIQIIYNTLIDNGRAIISLALDIKRNMFQNNNYAVYCYFSAFEHTYISPRMESCQSS